MICLVFARWVIQCGYLSKGFSAKAQGTSVGSTCLVDGISRGDADPCVAFALRANSNNNTLTYTYCYACVVSIDFYVMANKASLMRVWFAHSAVYLKNFANNASYSQNSNLNFRYTLCSSFSFLFNFMLVIFVND